MLKVILVYLWKRYEPSKEQKIATARWLLESTGYHIHRNRELVKPTPLFEQDKIQGGKEI
jgi:hypothetical protein